MKLNEQDAKKWVDLWQKESRESYIAAEGLYKNKQYHFSLFFCHLALEKIIKTYYLRKKQEFPPPVHDLLHLLSKSGLDIPRKDLLLYSEINTYNIRARYDDFRRSFYKKASLGYCHIWMENTHKLIKKIEKSL